MPTNQEAMNRAAHLNNLLAAGGAIATVLSTAVTFGFSQKAVASIVLGVAMLFGVHFLAKHLIRLKDARRAQVGDQELIDRIRSRPQKVGDPEAIRRLTEMAIKLETGIKKFQDTGQSITDATLPWYLLVGESGSGKSEAIRRSGINFAAGLNDEYQGSGGTVNMDWWFVNDGIILDTAGRLLVEQDETDSLGELQRFLQFIKKIRKDAPVNGMLLAIPADSLINDSVDNINRKSGMIAKRLDHIRRSLGVRFPVFVMITKSDLIPGFRAFFRDLNQTDTQHQIIGWSNPASLNDDFNPDDVDRYFATIRARMMKRRMALLLDPAHSENEHGGRRLDQVDELYEFPDALLSLAPNLRLYLQKIFVKARFAQEPLFLRGLYFTSSMEEGGALDKILAQFCGKTIQQMQGESKGWKVERSLFLTHLFNDKIFREKGLVTRSGDPEGIPRRHKMLLLAGAAVTILALGLFTWAGKQALTRNVKDQSDFWHNVADNFQQNPGKWRIVSDAAYHGRDSVGVGVGEMAGFLSRNYTAAATPIAVPMVFRPMTFLGGDKVNSERSVAYADVYLASVLRPLVDGSRLKLTGEAAIAAIGTTRPALTPEDGGALAELVRVKADALGLAEPGKSAMRLKPLFQFLLTGDDLKNALADCDGLQSTYDSVYPSEKERTDAARQLMPDADDARSSFLPIVQDWMGQADQRVHGQTGSLAELADIEKAVNRFTADEPKLFDPTGKTLALSDPADGDAVKRWNDAEQVLETDSAQVELAMAIAVRGIPALGKGSPLGDAYIAELAATGARESAAAANLIDSLNPDTIAQNADLAGIYQAVSGKVKEWSAEELAKDPSIAARAAVLNTLDQSQLRPIPETGGLRPIQARLAMYRTVRDALSAFTNRKPAKYSPADLATMISTQQWSAAGGVDPVSDARNSLAKLRAPQIPALEIAFAAGDAWLQNQLLPAYHAANMTALLAAAPATGEAYAQCVQSVPDSQDIGPLIADPLKVVNITVVAGKNGVNKYDEGFNFKRLKPFMDGCKALIASVPAGTPGNALAKRLADAQDQYLANYAGYWVANGGPADAVVWPQAWGWKDLHDYFPHLKVKAADVNEALRNLVQLQQDAMGILPEKLKAGPVADTISKNETMVAVLKKDAYSHDCQDTLDTWSSLSDDGAAARQQILKLTPTDFSSRFIEPDDDLPYWKNLSMQSLSLLVKQVPANEPSLLRQFRNQYGNKFPLAIPASADAAVDAKDILAPADLSKARDLWTQLRSQIPPGDATTAKTIGQGAKTADADVNQLLQHLLAPAPAPGDAAEFDRYRKLFDLLLPANDHTPTATVSVAVFDKSQANPVSSLWPLVHWTDGDLEEETSTHPGPNDPRALGTLPMVKAATVKVGFRRAANQPFDKTVTVETAWTPFLWLMQTRSRPADSTGDIDPDRPVRKVPLSVSDNGTNYVLWLELKFDGPIPTFDEWPKVQNEK